MSKDKLFRRIADEIPHGALMVDMDYRILDLNQKAQEIIGISPNACDGVSLLQYFILNEGGLAEEGIITEFTAKFMPPKMPIGITYRRRPLSRDRFLLLIDGCYEESEEQVRTQENAIDGFVSTVMHEIRTPVNVIENAAELMFQKSADPETSGRHLEIINRSAKRILKLVNNLMFLSQEEETGWPCRLERGNVVVGLAYTIDSMVEYAKSRGISIVRNFQVNEATALYDPDHLDRILMNLVTNAIKFSPDGSEVEVTVSKKNAGAILVSVKDHGIGIPADKQAAIFDKYKQITSMTVTKNQGSGLGLYIVKKLCQKQNIKIQLNSEPNVGSEFLLEIPAEGIREGRMLCEESVLFLSPMLLNRYEIEFSDCFQ